MRLQKNTLYDIIKHYYIKREVYTVRKILVYLKKYTFESITAPLLKLLEALLELIVPIVVALIIDRGIVGGDSAYVVKMVLLLLLMGGAGLAFSLTAQYFSAKAACSFSSDLRSALFRKIQSFSFSRLDTIGTHTLITRMSSDVNQVQSGVNLTLRLLLRSPFVAFGAMVMAFIVGRNAPSSTVAFAIVIPTLLVVIFIILLAGIPMYTKSQSTLDRITGKLRSNLDGSRVIRAFRLEDAQSEDFSKTVNISKRVQLAAGRISSLLNPLTFVIINVAIIALLYNGAIDVDSGNLTQGELIALYNYMTQILVELIKMANLIITVTKAIACAKRISAVMETESGMDSASVCSETYENAPLVSMENVSFMYEGSSGYVLENIDLTVNKGEKVGIIGGTGSGKSTLVSLIPRFYDVKDGRVRFDGRDVRALDTDSLRKRIGFAFQKTTLFRGSVASNVRKGKEDATDTEILDALRVAQISSLVENAKEGLDYPVEQGGRNLSGGQKQRLNVARAIIGRPELIILDDSSSALDRVTDAKLREAIANLDFSPALIIVSQRVESVAACDKILVLDGGRAAGLGTHSELYESCEVYREICDSQTGGELS